MFISFIPCFKDSSQIGRSNNDEFFRHSDFYSRIFRFKKNKKYNVRSDTKISLQLPEHASAKNGRFVEGCGIQTHASLYCYSTADHTPAHIQARLLSTKSGRKAGPFVCIKTYVIIKHYSLFT